MIEGSPLSGRWPLDDSRSNGISSSGHSRGSSTMFVRFLSFRLKLAMLVLNNLCAILFIFFSAFPVLSTILFYSLDPLFLMIPSLSF